MDKNLLDRYPFELSGGQRQRANIAISTFAEPSVLLVDEPTSSLDVTSQKRMVELLVDIHQRGIIDSLVVVSHDLGVLRQMCSHLAVMYAGRFVETGKIDDTVENPLHPPAACRFHPRSPECMDICKKKSPPMVERNSREVACWK